MASKTPVERWNVSGMTHGRCRLLQGSSGGNDRQKGALQVMRKAYHKPKLRKVGQLKDITRGFPSP